jgi:acyl phosphate:glycerol-3-phosphate acyltransferase
VANRRTIARVGRAATIGYFLGTFPSADIATRLSGRAGTDLRGEGSGNPGATNAAKILGKKWGALVLAADIAKGLGAGYAGLALGGPSGAYAAATSSIAGHIVPVWSKGRGGKGVATFGGASFSVFPIFFPLNAAVSVAAAKATRNAERAAQVSAATWVVGSLLWWKKQLPTAWGPKPTRGLPAFAIISSTLMVTKFRLAKTPPPPPPVSPSTTPTPTTAPAQNIQ